MHTSSTLTLSAGLLALALTGCNAGDPPPSGSPPASPPASASPAAAATGTGTAKPDNRLLDHADASVTGPLPQPARARAAAPSDTTIPADAVAWRCGERAITTHFDRATDAVRLTLAGRTLILLSAQAASGARFADAHGNQFWEHAGEATLSLAGGDAVKCVHETATTIG